MGRLFKLFVVIVLGSATACTTSPLRRHDVPHLTNSRQCGVILAEAKWDLEHTLLKTTQDLYQSGCYSESLKMGQILREQLRDKDYSITSEVLSVLGPEEMTQTYVLESHERVYLTLLLAMNFLKLEKRESAEVELRRASRELDAVLYNHGRDEVSSLLIAGLWEELGDSEMAAPYWRRLGLEALAKPGRAGGPWQIYTIGEMSGYDWSMGGAHSIYSVTPKSTIPKKCVSSTGALIPIDDWVRKMEVRHSMDYHPLLSVKSYVRFPLGLGYGLLLGTTGVGLAILGCGISAQGNSGGGEGCRASLEVGAAIAGQAPNAFNYAAQPDLRHWQNSPVAFLVTRSGDPVNESCAPVHTTKPLWTR